MQDHWICEICYMGHIKGLWQGPTTESMLKQKKHWEVWKVALGCKVVCMRQSKVGKKIIWMLLVWGQWWGTNTVPTHTSRQQKRTSVFAFGAFQSRQIMKQWTFPKFGAAVCSATLMPLWRKAKNTKHRRVNTNEPVTKCLKICLK